MKVVIIGGVAGGATAAARIRRLDEKAEIIVFERSGYVSYANCGLPYYIGGTIDNKNKLTLQTPKSFDQRFNVKMKVNHEVIAIHPNQKKITVKNLKTNEEFEESYDKLLLSMGAKPNMPRINGIESEEIFTLRTVEDTYKIKDFIEQNQPKSAVIVGGGFIGVEMAHNLRELGMEVSIVEAEKQLMTPFDSDMVSYIHNEMRKHNIHLALGSFVAGFEKKEKGIDVQIKDSSAIHADMVILSIGVSPETHLAKEAGLELGIRNSIIVNEHMETSIQDIYAVGDAIQIRHLVTQQDSLVSLAGPANKQARIAADNICGVSSSYKGTLGSSIIKIFDLTAASTGINERVAKQMNYDYDKVILSPMSHASYYPGGKSMSMKVIFEKETYRILGAQIVGYDAVDKRIDVLATAIAAKMKATELKELDLAYAPPYSSAKDPVNMAGFMIDNIKNGVLKQWYIEDLGNILKNEEVTLLDTRTEEEYEEGHIDGFVNIPVDELRERIQEIPTDKPVYVICQSGLRSYIASRILSGNHFESYNFTGGYGYYESVTHDKCLIEETHPCGMNK